MLVLVANVAHDRLVRALAASRWGDLDHGVDHLLLVLESAAYLDKLLQELVALRALIDSRMFHSLSQKCFGVVNDLHSRMVSSQLQ